MQRRAAEESLTDHGKDNSNGRAHVGDAIRHKPGILGFLRQIGFMGATVGIPALQQHIGILLVLMNKQATWGGFMFAVNQLLPKVRRHQLRRFLTKAVRNDDSNLSEEGQEEIFGVIARNMKSISESRPERLVRLQNDIELVNLQTLIDRFRTMLKSGHDESTWQVFFDENPFILSQAFGYSSGCVMSTALRARSPL